MINTKYRKLFWGLWSRWETIQKQEDELWHQIQELKKPVSTPVVNSKVLPDGKTTYTTSEEFKTPDSSLYEPLEKQIRQLRLEGRFVLDAMSQLTEKDLQEYEEAHPEPVVLTQEEQQENVHAFEEVFGI
jgi:hypothetical protein